MAKLAIILDIWQELVTMLKSFAHGFPRAKARQSRLPGVKDFTTSTPRQGSSLPWRLSCGRSSVESAGNRRTNEMIVTVAAVPPANYLWRSNRRKQC